MKPASNVRRRSRPPPVQREEMAMAKTAAAEAGLEVEEAVVVAAA